jgi:hypothetical protein
MSMKDITDKMTGDIAKDIQARTIATFNSIIMMTPVGNPNLWAINQQAATYNQAVSDENYRLRQDPANLTKAGRLRPGRKVKDSMAIWKPPGYVGGRARGNWQCSLDAPITSENGRIDPNGSAAKAEVKATVTAGRVNYLSNNVPYIRRLEYEGHSKQAPDGMVRISLARFGLGEIV